MNKTKLKRSLVHLILYLNATTIQLEILKSKSFWRTATNPHRTKNSWEAFTQNYYRFQRKTHLKMETSREKSSHDIHKYA